ncbi:MAG: hypothetical protein HY231_13805 [Acidobacteria bacterium]|nr:hypothetical protein [Acidobacteriota bacterium]
MKHLFSVLFCLLFFATAIAHPRALQQFQEVSESYSFENDFEGWTPRRMSDNRELPPTIDRSQALSKDGFTSLRIDVNRQFTFEDDWIEKAFFLEPNQFYELECEFAFASQDFTSSNPFIILTGATQKPVSTFEDFRNLQQEFAFYRGDASDGYKWLDKRYTLATRTNEDGKLYVALGVRGTDLFHRVYYLDRVHISIRKKASPTEFFPFKNDLEGWMPKGLDLDATTSINDAVKLWRSSTVDGVSALRFELSQSNSKSTIWVEKPFPVERGKKYKITIDYAIVPISRAYPQRSRLVTGISRKPTASLEDLSWFEDEIPDVGDFAFYLHKKYDFVVKAKKTDVLYVVIGINGKEDVRQIYHVDDVFITLEKK